MANEHFEQLRQIKQREIEGLIAELDKVVGQINAVRRARPGEAEPLRQHILTEQISSLEHHAQELQAQIEGARKDFRSYPLDNLPGPRNPDWVERDEEQQRFHELLQYKRQQLLNQGDVSPVYCCCHGLPGVGKTQFVLEYAHRRLGKDYNTVVWIDGSGADHRNATAKAARELNLVSGATPADDQLISALRTHLAYGGPHLVVIDKVDVPSALGRYLPRRGDVCVVITARQKELPFTPLTYRVELLDKARALHLLRGPQVLADAEEEQTATELCDYLGYLPLALMLARRVYMRSVPPSFRELYERIRQVGPARWRPSVDIEPLLLPYNNLSALFEVSYQTLKHDARWLAAAGGYFAPAPIERDLLCEAGALLAQEPRPWTEDKDRWLGALEQIDYSGLSEHSVDHVLRNGQTIAVIRVRIHRLLQDYLRSVTNDETAARSAVCDALAHLVKRTPLQAGPLRDLRHHIPHLQEALRHHKSDQEPSPALYQIVLGLVRHRCLMGEYAEGLRLCDKYLPAPGQLPSTAAGGVIELRHQRAFALRNRREFDAALIDYLEVLQWSRANLGDGRLVTYFPQHDIGAIYLEQHRFAEAQAMFSSIHERMVDLLRQRGATAKRDLDPETRGLHISRALALTDLGRAEIGLAQSVSVSESGEILPGQVHHEEPVPVDAIDGALARYEEALQLFADLRMEGDLFAARPLLAQAVALRLKAKTLPGRSTEQFDVLSRAEAAANHALLIRQIELSTLHPYLIGIYEELGRIYNDQGNNDAAQKAYEHALVLSKRPQGG